MATTVFQKLFVNIAKRRLEISDNGGGETRIGDLYKYGTLPIRVVLIEEDPDGELGSFERKPVSNLSLRVTVNDTLDDAAPLAQQASFTADSSNNSFTGILDLNTATMSSYIGSATSKTAYFQIEFSESGGGWTPVYQEEVRVKNSVTQPTTTSPDPTQTFRTLAESDAVYLTPIVRPGVYLGLRSPSGNKIRWLGVDDVGTPIDSIEDYTE